MTDIVNQNGMWQAYLDGSPVGEECECQADAEYVLECAIEDANG